MDDQLQICPYNHEHVIRTNRMPRHIVKCAKTYRGPPLEQCRYNASHLVPPLELEQHESECKDFLKSNRYELYKDSQSLKKNKN